MFGLGQTHAQALPTSASPVVSQISQIDIDADTHIDLSILDTNFASEHDRIYVYDTDGDMSDGNSWESITDFDDDIWIFDVGTTNDAQLIIVFSSVDGSSQASIYSDVNGDKKVDYTINGKEVIITESSYPTLSVKAKGNWLRDDGQLNWNLTFNIDGSTINPSYIVGTTLLKYSEYFSLDGKPDIELRFYDDDNDGVPEYQVLRLLADTPESYDLEPRTIVFANEGRHNTTFIKNGIFWYFLFDQAFEEYFTQISANFFDTSPIIFVDWQNANLVHPQIIGYPIEDGYMVKTFEYFRDGVINPTDFETNMNWYDLAQDSDTYPELHIRNRYYDAYDSTGGDLPIPIDDIRYSWNQTNRGNLHWDYKLGLAGRYLVDEHIDLDNLSFRSIPHNELPQWVISKEWDIATFLHRDIVFDSSEGIYDWPALEHSVENSFLTLPRYMAGDRDIDLESVYRTEVGGEETSKLTDLQTGIRGEVALELQAKVTLYLSPIDRLLHLAHADFCIWDLDEHYRIECDNLNDDAYLDTWQVIEDGTVVQQLFQLENFIVSVDGTTIAIKEAYVPPALFETSPPTNHDEWLSLKEKLEVIASVESLPEMTNLRSIFDQIAGNAWSSEGVIVHDIVPTHSGLRFKMTITDSYANVQNGLNIAFDPQPGDEFIVDLDNQIITIEPLIPATLSIRPENIWFEQSQIVEYDYATMHIPIDKLGNDYSNEVTVVLSGTQDDIYSIIDSYTLSLGIEEDYEVLIPWLPSDAGQWNLMVEIIDDNANPDAESLAKTQFTIDVQQNNSNQLLIIMSLDGEHVLGGFLLVGLIIIIGILGFMLFVVIVIMSEDTESNPND